LPLEDGFQKTLELSLSGAAVVAAPMGLTALLREYVFFVFVHGLIYFRPHSLVSAELDIGI